ncbi:MAG: YaiI/YqxD family protein [Candidatus Hydrogenedentes bacterium]|nr:YaiI/YqxD family protein [Candidatus Hydrogenedentota bacterium]
MTHIYVDADGCPVKNEIYCVAKRYDIPVTLVANSRMRTPDEAGIEFVLVDDGFDAADDWIVERVGTNEIVVTADIPLAARCIEKGARVLGPKGRVFTEDSIGGALSDREVSSQLREHGMMTGGPAPFGKKDRSRFLQGLDATIHACRRAMQQ